MAECFYTPTVENLRDCADAERVSHNPVVAYMLDGAANRIERLRAALSAVLTDGFEAGDKDPWWVPSADALKLAREALDEQIGTGDEAHRPGKN